MQALFLADGLVEPEFFFEMPEGGFEVEEAGSDRASDVVALFVQHPVEQAMVLPEAGILFAGVCFDVVQAKHRIEFLKVGAIIFFHHIVNGVGDGGRSSSFAIVDF